ncbi:MAG: hypothetical protein JW955_14640 [Sedimentisphaerales bacterium]|nr:hypothetical protein [Sedimentisphaerales bacterium]
MSTRKPTKRWQPLRTDTPAPAKVDRGTTEKAAAYGIPFVTTILAAGLGMLANHILGCILVGVALAVPWFFVTRSGWAPFLSTKRCMYPGYLAILVLCLVFALCLPDDRPNDVEDINQAGPKPPSVTATAQDSPGAIPVAIGQVNGPVTINPPAKTETDWLLTPANEPDPFVVRKAVPPDALKVFLGNNVGWIKTMGLHTVLRLGRADIISVARTPKGLFVYAHIWREDGRELATIEANRITYNENNYYVKLPEMTDRHELKVFGKDGALIWTVRYINEQSIVCRGTFCAPNYPSLTVTEDKVQLGPLTISGNNAAETLLADGSVFWF